MKILLSLSSRNLLLNAFCLLVILTAALSAFGQNLDFERARHRSILDTVKSDVKRYYYDSTYRGIDLDVRFKAAEERIKNAKSIGEMTGIIAQVLVEFNDSHLFFLPPEKSSKTDYGWEMQLIGDRCFIVAVKKGSDAEAQSVKPGDEVFALDGFEPTRENLWKMNYFYHALRPRSAVKMEIVKPDGKRVEVVLKSKVVDGKRVKDLGDTIELNNYMREGEDQYVRSRQQRYYDKIENLLVWRMPGFALSPNDVDGIMDKVRKRQNLILDLRGNGGGRVDMLARLVGNMFAEDVTIGEKKERKKSTTEIAKSVGKNFYNGKIIILIDSESASASEVFARVMQLEKRGIVLGDRSAGAVMTSIQQPHELGMDTVINFAVSVTVGDLIMKDGKSLERIGVAPNEKILPSAQDLAEKRDPVLARAAEILGFKLSSEEAGKIFPDVSKK